MLNWIGFLLLIIPSAVLGGLGGLLGGLLGGAGGPIVGTYVGTLAGVVAASYVLRDAPRNGGAGSRASPRRG